METIGQVASEPATELRQYLKENKAYVLIIGGKEYNVYIDKIGSHYLFGRVSQNKVALLIDRPGRGGTVTKIVDPQEEMSAVGPGDELIYSEPCVVPSQTLRIRVKLDDVSIIEDPWRPMVGDNVFTSNGIDTNALCEAIPAFSAYKKSENGEFSSSPAAWTPLKLHLSKDSDSGDSDENND